MIGLTEAVIASALYLLWKGGVISKPVVSKTPPAKPPVATKPADVTWPTTEPHEGFPPGHEPTVTELQRKEAADVARARELATKKHDLDALAAIRQRERQRQKALQDYAAQRKAYEASQR